MTAEGLRGALAPLWDQGGLRMLVLFGSVAKGSASAASDLDLAVLPEGTLDAVALTAEIVRLTHCNDVDLVDLTRADPVLALQVAESGIVLFAKEPTEFSEFRSLAWRRFVDTGKLRLAQRRALDLFEQRHDTR